MSDYDTNDSMLELYLFESTTLLEQLDEILLQSEHDKNLSQDNINEIFRTMHTIKGSSAMMSFNIIAEVSHKLEDLFFIVRDRGGVDEDYFEVLFDLVLRVSDFLKTEVDKIQQGEELSDEKPPLVDEILNLIAAMKGGEAEAAKPAAKAGSKAGKKSEGKAGAKAGAKAGSKAEAPAPERAEDDAPAELLEGESMFRLHVYFTEDCQMENIRAFMLVSKLQTMGEVLRIIPDDLEGNPEAADIIKERGFFCTFVTALSRDEVEANAKATLSVDTVSFVDLLPDEEAPAADDAPPAPAQAQTPERAPDRPAEAPAEAPAPPAEAPKAQASAPKAADGDKSEHKPTKQNLINVDLNKLDVLMNLVGELVITESMVSGSPDLAGLELENFHKAARQLRKLTDEIQDTVMSVRMMPVATTFQKMRRIVRDMGKQLDKEVELTLEGESTEVDKTIIDALGDPLMHLVRNAMDHAIELKADRANTSKPPVGSIVLSAQNVGGDILISVSDDGKGLDAEYIIAKARDRGLLTKPESEYSEKEIFNLLMLPGFSTKEQVTEFSGRGVGMDVVKKNIEKIGGIVTIESVKGRGTTVYFKIPLTLAIIASMEIEAGGNTYAIPIVNIRESFKAAESQLLSDPDGNEMIMIRGAAYPIIRLHRIFNIDGCIENVVDGILLLVDSGDRLACILADKLLGKHQVVVKPLPSYLSHYDVKSTGIAGCTILGDGSISLILDVPRILTQY
ncbi:MAG: chemotaxis protein CheA [Clostridiales Family XIII bacterium]|jgi:two-component system chemotaxis sensor kinase CheA|nr:chemotaxis protein CheA [Clostridiales Family XIII bacterium]